VNLCNYCNILTMLVGKYVPLAYLIYPGITSLYRESAENLIRNNGRTFSAVWNIPSWNCPKLGVDLELDKYGIQHNINQSWNGSVMNIFYSKNNGYWPYFDNDAVFKRIETSERVSGSRFQNFLCHYGCKYLSSSFFRKLFKK